MVVQYSYDLAGRVSEMVKGLEAATARILPAGAVTHYTQNNAGYWSVMTDPMGYSEYYNDYDYNGNLLSKQDKNGNVFNYKYGPYGILETQALKTQGKQRNIHITYIGQLTEKYRCNIDRGRGISRMEG